jgi:PAS domain S-box-containing protein
MSNAGTGDSEDELADFGPRTASDQPSWIMRRHAFVSVVACFVLLAVTCLFAGILVWRDIEATSAVDDARDTRRYGTLILAAVLNAETGQRGFLLTHDANYLTPYYAAMDAFQTSLTVLRARSPDNPQFAALIATLARAGGAKFTELERTIALGKAGRFDDAVEEVRTGPGRSLMEELRHTVDDLTADANESVAQTTATQRWIDSLLLAAILSALICVSWLAALLLKDARRNFGRLQTREITARQLAETLEVRVAQRTRELAEANQRFEAALRASGVTVMSQDRDLVFNWISRGIFGKSAQAIIGKPQDEVIPEAAPATATNLKRSVIKTGEPARGDVRVVYDGAETWYDLSVHPLTDESGATTGIIAGAIDITRYKEQEGRIRLLMRELTHRSKNLLAVIQAIMRQTATNSESLSDFETRFSARLQSLAESHDLLVREDWQGASMREIVRSQLGHYIDRVGSQIELSGDSLQIHPDAAQHIGMAMHELATNAAKYGALSVPAGKVRISWHVASGASGVPTCHLSWEESGGPPVERPARRGFGRVVIERTVARAVHGEVRIDYSPAGLQWTLVFPEKPLADE